MSSTDVFLSHNWGTDELGRDNHARVARINDALKLHGYKTWFDHEEMYGDITSRMAEGIEKTKAVIVFLTRKYYDKVNGENEKDNCKKEFRYSTERKGRSKMIAVIMDSSMKETSSWKRTICMCLCDKIFIDMSEDIEDPNYLNSQIQLLSKELKAIGIEPDDAGTKQQDAVCQITSNYRNNHDDVILELTSYHSDGISLNDNRIDEFLLLSENNYVLRISNKYSSIQDIQDIFFSIYNKQIDVPDEMTGPRHISSGNSIISIYSHTSQQPKKKIEMKPKDEIILQWNQEEYKSTKSYWEDCCLRYLNSQSFNEQNVLTETIDVFTNTHTEVKDFVGRLKKMKTKLHFAIIGGYNPIEHYNLLYTPPFETKREGFQNFLVLLRQEPFEIWCLSMTYSEKVEDLLVEIQESCRRVELVALANKKFVESLDSKPTIYNVVVVPKIKTDALNRWCCKFCYVMPMEIYSDVKEMESFFDKLRECGERKICKKSFKKLASSIIGFAATIAGKIKIWGVTSHDLIQYTQLTNQQQNILSSCNKESFMKCFIKGDYGSGKTVLGLFLLKKIVESAKTNARVWYIAFVKSELLLQNIKLYLNQFFSVKNKDEDRKWCHQINLSITVDIEVCFAADIKGESSIVSKPSHVITTLKKLHPNVNIHHFIFDEYDAEGLDRNEAESLKQLTEKEFKESCIIVLVQALEKFRTYHDGKSKIEHDKFKYSETGMTVYGPLITAMRNPKQIHELLTAAKKLMKFQENTFYHNVMKNKEHTQPSISAQSFNNKETGSKRNNNYDVFTRKSTNQNQSGKMNSIKNAMTDVETSSSLKPKKTQSVIIEDVDIIASKFHDNNMEGNVKTTTKMFYHESHLGNEIECEKNPVFVSFNWDNDSEGFASLCIYFKYHFFTHHRKSALFICNKGEHQTIYKEILEFVGKKYILLNDSDEGEYSTSCKRLQSNEEDLAIICNTKSSSGCEFPNVVVCVHPGEHHLRHHFIDSVSRCTSYLTMVCLDNYNPTTSDLSDTTLHYIVKHLKEKNLLEYIPLGLVDELPPWQDYEYDEESSTTYNINKKTENFIALCKQRFEYSAVKKNPSPTSELLGVIKRMTDGLSINTKKDDDGDNDNGGGAEAANDGIKNINASSDFDSYTEADIKRLILNSNIEKLKSLSSQWPDVIIKNLDNETPLLWASRRGYADVVKILIDSGANVHVVGSMLNQTSLHLASDKGHADIVKILIDSGANVHVVNSYNQTPLHYASYNGHADIVKILIDSGANVNVVDSDNRTLLHYASYNGHADIVKILIDSGAIVNVVDSDNQTPLHYASRRGRADVVKMLIDSGANVNVAGGMFNRRPLLFCEVM